LEKAREKRDAMKAPKECLCFALDVPGTEEARRFVEMLSPHVGLFKVGLELFVKEGPGLLFSVKEWGAEKIFLDLKLHDIPRTVERARRSAGKLPVDFLSVHCESLWSGPSGGQPPEGEAKPAMLGITVLTSLPEEDLPHLGYAEGLSSIDLVLMRAEMAKRGGCAGVVCSGREVEAVRERFGSDFTILTPGVRPEWSVVAKDDQARVLTPGDAIQLGSDIVVVGRPIAGAPDPAEAARKILEEIEQGLSARGQ
jgi:orotidine-5'-phosphate decarboxylase